MSQSSEANQFSKSLSWFVSVISCGFVNRVFWAYAVHEVSDSLRNLGVLCVSAVFLQLP